MESRLGQLIKINQEYLLLRTLFLSHPERASLQMSAYLSLIYLCMYLHHSNPSLADHHFRYPAVISNPQMATPALQIAYGTQSLVAAAFIKSSDGRQTLEFYFDQVCEILYVLFMLIRSSINRHHGRYPLWCLVPLGYNGCQMEYTQDSEE